MSSSLGKISCIIYTADSSCASQEADMIVLPGAEGDLGVLHSHCSMIVSLVKGDIKIYNSNEITETIPLEEAKIAYIDNNLIEIF
ncbi:MAG: hypothetical protein SFT68_05420 [Rickettsiaceae bacterium]|nr:hypothetical protein [Rickettsiaceae bacterium]